MGLFDLVVQGSHRAVTSDVQEPDTEQVDGRFVLSEVKVERVSSYVLRRKKSTYKTLQD